MIDPVLDPLAALLMGALLGYGMGFLRGKRMPNPIRGEARRWRYEEERRRALAAFEAGQEVPKTITRPRHN